jgi:hypothetical protein
MLKICQTPFPQSLLSYVAFRVAFRETFENLMLHRKCLSDQFAPFGYLCEVPYLQEVAPAVQLDLLASVWHKHVDRAEFQADLVEESIVYAACEMTARLVERDPELVGRRLANGPFDLTVPIDIYLARELRLLYLELPNDADFLLASQFLDLDPDAAAEQKEQMGIDPQQMNGLLDVLGRWHVSLQLPERLKGMMTEPEIARVATMLRVPCPA